MGVWIWPLQPISDLQRRPPRRRESGPPAAVDDKISVCDLVIITVPFQAQVHSLRSVDKYYKVSAIEEPLFIGINGKHTTTPLKEVWMNSLRFVNELRIRLYFHSWVFRSLVVSINENHVNVDRVTCPHMIMIVFINFMSGGS